VGGPSREIATASFKCKPKVLNCELRIRVFPGRTSTTKTKSEDIPDRMPDKNVGIDARSIAGIECQIACQNIWQNIWPKNDR
jgi:hypothetical protein